MEFSEPINLKIRLYTFRNSNFGNGRGCVGAFDKGFASMELA